MRTSSSSSNLLGFAQSASLMDPADSLLPFTVEGVLVGWVKRSFAPHLENWPEHFTIRPRGVGMLGHFETAEHRSAALNEVVEALASGGVIHGWRNETVTVAESFYAEVRKYWPALADGALVPDYAGIRPKIQAPGEPSRDFLIQGPADHGVPGLVNLFGIESPGLTSSLAIGRYVSELV